MLPPTPEVVASFNVESRVIWPDGNDDAYRLRRGSNPMPGPAFIAHYTDIDPSPDYQTLAEDLTAGADGWYRKARAIQDWLMGPEFSYSLEPGGDSVDDRLRWFLFENRQGYCSYYAAAFVTLARHLGIPSRVAYGYLAMPENAVYDRYPVYENTAHAWGEVWIPGIGWMTFEVTNQNGFEPPPGENQQQQDRMTPLLRDLLEHEPKEIPQSDATDDAFGVLKVGGWTWLFFALIALAVALIAAGKVWRIERWWPARGHHDSSTRRLMADISELEDLGLEPRHGETLNAYAQRFKLDHDVDIGERVDALYRQRFAPPRDEPAQATIARLRVPHIPWYRRLGGVFRLKSLVDGVRRFRNPELTGSDTPRS